MYRILIVDDEPDIVDSLYLLFKEIEQRELDVYRAYSAKEALGWLDRTKMDIVLTDIRMPGMTGLQMMEVILGKWPQSRIIFLTGFNEFDYVYTAIKHNGVKYLLKNEGHEAIIETVENVIQEIEKSREINDLIADARQQTDLAMPLLQKEYLMEILSGEVTGTEVRKKQFTEMKLPFEASAPVLLMAGRIDNPRGDMSSIDRYKLVNIINAVVSKYLMYKVKSVCLEYEGFGILWVIQPLGLEDGVSEGEDYRAPEYWGRLFLFIKGTLETIQDICEHSLNTPVSFIVDNEYTEWEMAPFRFEALKKLFEIQRNEEKERSQAAIDKVQKYINEHLHEDLSLVRLGELVYFNPSYLSRLFKRITGENLLKYINEVRLSKSKELLLDRNLKIQEIAAKLGFISAPYFTRFFKKRLNMSPQEFRDSFLNK